MSAPATRENMEARAPWRSLSKYSSLVGVVDTSVFTFTPTRVPGASEAAVVMYYPAEFK